MLPSQRTNHMFALTGRGSWFAIGLVVLATLLSGCSFSSSGSDQPGDQIANATEPIEVTPLPTPISIKEPTPAPTVEITATSTPLVPPTPEIPASQLSATIDQLLLNEPGVYGVVVIDANGNHVYARNSNLPFVAASLYKLVLMADIYASVDAGNVLLTQSITLAPEWFEDPANAGDSFFTLEDAGTAIPVEDLLFATGAYSSNIAAKALLTLATPESVRAMAESMGMVDTYFSVDPTTLPLWPERFEDDSNIDAFEAIAFVEAQAFDGPVNLTTPVDIATYWSKLLQGEVVNADVSSSILDILAQQVIVDRLPMLLPEEVTVANKTGNLDNVAHDTGVIYTSEGPVIVVALSEGEPSVPHATQLIQRIALAAIGDTDLPPIEE